MVARILVVEDNPLNLKLMRDVLEYQGFEVLTAMSGEEGVAVASSSSPDLVLMDLQLPGIGGHEALLRMRSDPRCRKIPVVAVTAFAMKDDIERADAGRVRRLHRETDQRARPTGAARPIPSGRRQCLIR